MIMHSMMRVRHKAAKTFCLKSIRGSGALFFSRLAKYDPCAMRHASCVMCHASPDLGRAVRSLRGLRHHTGQAEEGGAQGEGGLPPLPLLRLEEAHDWRIRQVVMLKTKMTKTILRIDAYPV